MPSETPVAKATAGNPKPLAGAIKKKLFLSASSPNFGFRSVSICQGKLHQVGPIQTWYSLRKFDQTFLSLTSQQTFHPLINLYD